MSYISATYVVGLSSFHFTRWSPKDTLCARECIMAVQDHPKWFISVHRRSMLSADNSQSIPVLTSEMAPY